MKLQIFVEPSVVCCQPDDRPQHCDTFRNAFGAGNGRAAPDQNIEGPGALLWIFVQLGGIFAHSLWGGLDRSFDRTGPILTVLFISYAQ